MLRSSNRRGGYIEPYLLAGRRRSPRPPRRATLARALTSPLVLVALPIGAAVLITLLW